MIEFKKPALEDRAWVEPLLAQGDERGCEYNFSTLYLWCHAFHVEIARVDGFFTERLCAPNGCHYLFPAGRGDLPAVLAALEEDSRRRGQPFSLTGVNPEDRETLEELFPGRFQYTPNRFSFDYLYTVDKLADLAGKKLHGKRNHIHRFEENWPGWTFEELTPAMLNAITKFLKDNDVTASIEPGTPHAALKEEFSRLDLRSVGLPEFLENRNELDKANEG